jgi:hypothetical protein
MKHNLKVELIRDDPKRGRVRVPECTVSYYVAGAAKKTSDGRTNNMRHKSWMEAEGKKARLKTSYPRKATRKACQ